MILINTVMMVSISRVSTINVVQWFERKTNIVGMFQPKTSNVSNEITGGV
jgi:hypothetical protein